VDERSAKSGKVVSGRRR